MLSELKKRFKSKTYWKEIIAGTLVILETHYGLLQELLGNHYGWSYMIIMIAGFVVREVTKKSIDDK